MSRITPEVLDAYHHLSDTRWQLYTCADCDPRNMEQEDEDYGKYDKEYSLVVPFGTLPPDYCPRCGNYLGLCDTTEVRVTTELRSQ